MVLVARLFFLFFSFFGGVGGFCFLGGIGGFFIGHFIRGLVFQIHPHDICQQGLSFLCGAGIHHLLHDMHTSTDNAMSCFAPDS